MARRRLRGVRNRLKRTGNTVVDQAALGLLKTLRLTNPRHLVPLSAAILRRLGPLMPEHRLGRANLRAAFPEKSAAEIEAILREVWDNLGRVSAEVVHLDRLFEQDRISAGDYVQGTPRSFELYDRIRGRKKPALFFGAHLANWEVLAAVAKVTDVPLTVLFRPPNLRAVGDAIVKLRTEAMGTIIAAGSHALFKIKGAMERGENVAMLVDQHLTQGVDVTFFGRSAKANPTFGMLARAFDCDIYGGRSIRLPDHRLLIDIAGPIEVPRDADGLIDVAGTMQAVTSVIEGWVREHPGQWLWLHRRWR